LFAAHSFDHIIGGIALVVAIATGLVALFTKPIKRAIAKRSSRVMAIVAIPNMLKTVEWIAAELKPNAGSSLRDAVDKIHKSSDDSRSLVLSYLNMDERPMFIVDTEVQMLWCNRAYSTLLQRDTADLLGNGFWSSISEESGPSARQRAEEYENEGVLYQELRVTYVRPSGSKVTATVHTFPIDNSKGENTGIMGYLSGVKLPYGETR
jgi:PAS domain S-box-containing protein